MMKRMVYSVACVRIMSHGRVSHMSLQSLYSIPTPAYVADRRRIEANLAVSERIKAATGCTILLATKSFAAFGLFDSFRAVLDGTTASGLYEAMLGHTHFGGQVHAYSPAFTDGDIAGLAPICGHISFNSVAQLRIHGHHFAVKGLRLNPRLSLVKNNPIYDPSSPCSRFGVDVGALTPEVLAEMNLLHVHNLCESQAEDSVALIDHLMQLCPQALDAVEHVNIGGGHYFTHPDYDVDAFISAINRLQSKHKVKVIVESGAAHVYDAGYLVAKVVDVIHNRDAQIAVLNTSATCHMPDVLEVPYRPNVVGDDAAHAHEYILAGNTCLTGDVIGTYRFAAPLKVGDTVIFTDMMQYSFVKNTTFNGVPLPDIGVLEKDGTYRIIRSFGYEDFERRLS
jgi:carboxynorspermidine decarboxylase